MERTRTRKTSVEGARNARNLILVLGDQLSPGISSLRNADREQDVVLMMEVAEEATYVPHHKKKIALLFSAMRHFTAELRAAGWRVDYRELAATGENGSFTSELTRAVETHRPRSIVVTEPGEWRVRQAMDTWNGLLGLPVDILEDHRFICSHEEFRTWAQGRKQLRMEYFYREMRRKTGLLMRDGEPEGGQWNFDHDNRKRAAADLFMPEPLHIAPDATTRDVLSLVAKRFAHHFGDLEPFWFAVTRKDAQRALDHFLAHALAAFGDYQDAMLSNHRFLYHSVLSAYINCGLLDPLEVCRRAEAAYRAGRVPLNAAEGFIRQIIGWREYVRGIYWLKMPDYLENNFFGHTRDVPGFYWTGQTAMACLRAAITQTKEEAYAHHIQRLMLTGNFAMLAGVSPKALHAWYLLVYADAYEWVELPNTLGMSQFADGGLLASKPYAASGAYISRMSDHCKGCAYDVKSSAGARSCPFNALYWQFLDRNRGKLEGNPRMAQMYRTWDRMSPDKRSSILQTAAGTLGKLDASKSNSNAPVL